MMIAPTAVMSNSCPVAKSNNPATSFPFEISPSRNSGQNPRKALQIKVS